MPVSPTYPGVYIEEIPSGVRTITGVSTSITAFVGRARKGEPDQPTRILSPSDYSREFGGLWEESSMSYAVQDYFQHGGKEAIIVRIVDGGSPAEIELDAGAAPGNVVLVAASDGSWGDNLQASVNHATMDADAAVPDENLFNLIVEEINPDTGNPRSTETFLNVSIDDTSPRFVREILAQQSQLVRVDDAENFDTGRPNVTAAPVAATTDGDDGDPLSDVTISGGTTNADNRGMYALRRADLFNLLCIPPLQLATFGDAEVAEDDFYGNTIPAAAAFCQEERAMLIVDPRSDWESVSDAETGVNTIRGAIGNNAAINAMAYFPLLEKSDSLRDNLIRDFPPCGTVAGIIARTDSQRGVWKAPAGLEASLSGVRGLSLKLTDGESGVLNPLGLNCLRSFPVNGTVVWGSRTLAGADALASEWKYIPVRRLALFLEESLYRGSQWVVFEPNDEPLWAQIRLNMGAFMQNLFRQGAFQGTTARDAYFVKCDSETTTQNDIDRGIVNILVGFAPLKPAEFVIIQLQQKAGEIQT